MKTISIDLQTLGEEVLKRKKEERENFDRAVQEGDIAIMEEYFRAHKGHGHIAEEKTTIVSNMIMHPEKIRNGLAVFEATTAKDYSFDHLFDNRVIKEIDLWTMPVRDATPDTVKVAARLLAEYMRCEIVLKDDYKFDPNALMKEVCFEGNLSGEAKKTEARNAIISMQNALVDYIAEEGDRLMASRGAAFLKIMGSDLPKGIHHLTTQKIRDFTTADTYSVKHGDIERIVPVFNPM